MDVAEFADIKHSTHEGEEIYFCGGTCAGRFKKDPERFQGEPLIRIRNVRKTFRMGSTNVHVLRGLNIHIWEGDFVAIIGASGSGKSTALNMFGLLDRPSGGEIFLNGEDVSTLTDEKRAALRSQTFGFVFQQYNLIPWLTAYENVTLPLLFTKTAVNEKGITAQFRHIGLAERMTHRPVELSGGEQQRVALLRALANDPDVILGDEPTGNLDSATGKTILQILMDLNKTKKKTLVIITHDADIAEKADQIITLKDGLVIQDHATHKKIYTE